MTFIRSCILALLLLASGPLAAAEANWHSAGSDIPTDPAWQFGTLPNGVRYAVRRNALPAGQVSVRVRIDAGSINEQDNERGWAHFIEHLVFRGTTHFADREARHTWEQLGASFGSDTNANTDEIRTLFQLDLPNASRTSLDRSLAILADMMDNALIDPATVDAERKVVLAEKGRRPELNVRYSEIARKLFLAGMRSGVRDPIGTDETLNAASAPALRAFYERWYRPERATVIVVGDADPAMMAELIAQRFGTWHGTGAGPADPDHGHVADVARRAEALVYPGAPSNTTVAWLRPHEVRPDTIALERSQLEETLAMQIVNRRLEKKAEAGASFLGAGVGIARSKYVADQTQLSSAAKEGLWRQALSEEFAIVADALRTPPSEAEIARELSNLRSVMKTAVEAEATVQSQQRAEQLAGAIDSGDIATSAATARALVERLAPDMTPAHVEEGMKRVFGTTPPRLLLLTPQAVDGGPATLSAALTAAERAAPAERSTERSVSFAALPALGAPGKEVSRQRIEDMDVTIVRFANGSTLTFKHTDFQKGQVSVQLRFGTGLGGLSPRERQAAWTAGLVAPSGLADLDLDAMSRLLTGRRITLNFGMDEEAYVLSGETNGGDLSDQLRLLATKLAYPRWDEALFNRARAGWLQSYELSFASAAARGGREFGEITHPGDARWLPLEKDMIASIAPVQMRDFFAPVLAAGPVQAIIVGDVDLDTAVAAMRRTIAALPSRPAPPPAGLPPAAPRPNPKPRVFTHKGDMDQAYVLIGWSTFGGMQKMRDQRALSIATSILRDRLFDRLREEEGASYAPGAFSASSDSFPAWGIFYAAAEVKPASVETFLRVTREEVARLAKAPVSPDEFARAQNPIVSTVERQLKLNGFWVAALQEWTSDPARIERTRTFLADYKGMTAEDVRRAVATYVADEGDWSMVVLPEKAQESGH